MLLWSYWFLYGILCAVSKWLLLCHIWSYQKFPLINDVLIKTHNHGRLVIAGFDYERMGEGIMVPSQRLQWQLWSYVAQNKVRLKKKQNSEIANKKLQKWKAKKAWHKLGTWTHDGFTDSYILKQKQSNNRNKQKFIMFAPLVRLYFRLVFTFCPVSSQFCALCWEKTTTLASTPSLLDSARAVETACIHHFSSSFIQIRTQLGDYTPLHGSASGIL